MIEFAVAIIAVLAIASALFQISSLSRARRETLNNARLEAGEASLRQAVVSPNPEYILDWKPGSDESRYTADDEFTSAGGLAFQSRIISRAARDPFGWSVIDSTGSPYVGLHSSGKPVNQLGLVKGADAEKVELLDAVRHLLYNASEIEVKANVWMTQLGGIY